MTEPMWVPDLFPRHGVPRLRWRIQEVKEYLQYLQSRERLLLSLEAMRRLDDFERTGQAH